MACASSRGSIFLRRLGASKSISSQHGRRDLAACMMMICRHQGSTRVKPASIQGSEGEGKQGTRAGVRSKSKSAGYSCDWCCNG